MSNWSIADIPPQHGRTAVITGATGGLGYETALALAGAGAMVVLTGRSEAKGRFALQAIRDRFPNASLSYADLDLAKLASVADFAARFAADHASLDLLINNAGVMALPARQVTADGFEMQFGTNYLGHYALTARLLALLRRGNGPRVVNLSSLAHRSGANRFWRSARCALLSAVEGLQPVETGDADVRARAATPQRRRRLGPDEQRRASRLRAHRVDRQRGRATAGCSGRSAACFSLMSVNRRPRARCPPCLPQPRRRRSHPAITARTGFMS